MSELRRRVDHLAAIYGQEAPCLPSGAELTAERYVRLHQQIYSEALGAPAGTEIAELCRLLLAPVEPEGHGGP